MAIESAILALIININTQPDLIKESEKNLSTYIALESNPIYKCNRDSWTNWTNACSYKLYHKSLFTEQRNLLITRDIVNSTNSNEEKRIVFVLSRSINWSIIRISQYQCSHK